MKVIRGAQVQHTHTARCNAITKLIIHRRIIYRYMHNSTSVRASERIITKESAESSTHASLAMQQQQQRQQLKLDVGSKYARARDRALYVQHRPPSGIVIHETRNRNRTYSFKITRRPEKKVYYCDLSLYFLRAHKNFFKKGVAQETAVPYKKTSVIDIKKIILFMRWGCNIFCTDLGSRGAPASVPTEVSCNAKNGVIGSWLHETRLASRRTRVIVWKVDLVDYDFQSQIWFGDHHFAEATVLVVFSYSVIDDELHVLYVSYKADTLQNF
ncbi:unnamed protein product [Trichogramma brassicae]|uniref:Uncharacterized protein n=1 Tax=Trichogramma brassicae TaxID=86971 RepID=A0A6H5I3Y0_9HYME|nr:unnamed protein product [Trichogramma brassicae]